MTIAVRNVLAAQDPQSGAWRHTADLVLPDGSTGHLDMLLTSAQQHYYEALVSTDVAPGLWANGSAGPVIATDVTRLLGVFAIGQQLPPAPAQPPTMFRGPDLQQ